MNSYMESYSMDEIDDGKFYAMTILKKNNNIFMSNIIFSAENFQQ